VDQDEIVMLREAHEADQRNIQDLLEEIATIRNQLAIEQAKNLAACQTRRPDAEDDNRGGKVTSGGFFSSVKTLFGKRNQTDVAH